MARPKKRYNDQYEAPLIKLHPAKISLYLLILGMSILFVTFSLGYVYTRNENGAGGVYLPPIFIINTVLLLASSWTIKKANEAYTEDDTRKYQLSLWGTFILTMVFLAAQVSAWTVFKSDFFGENIGNGENYLYMISWLHFAHVVGGLPFLLAFIYVAYKRMKEPVSVLIYFSDPDKRMRLQLLTTYWHFLDILWIFLVVFFLLNMFI